MRSIAMDLVTKEIKNMNTPSREELAIQGYNITDSLLEEVQGIFPYCEYETDTENNIVGYRQFEYISYNISNKVVNENETVIIEVSLPYIEVEAEDSSYIVIDKIIEYSNGNKGMYQLKLSAEGYMPTIIEIEVI